MAPSEEIARLERELAELRSHYAHLERNGRVMKRGSMFMLAALAVFLGYLLWADFVMGALAVAVAAAIAVLVCFLPASNRRWIDAGTPMGEFEFGSSQAQKVEQWIADREVRLAQLRLAGSASSPATDR
ncbi:hypothetical protein JQ634_17685 [Bradyrhizobium sp. AUGA SZCCT0240]|uniref:hypothetical protein n=1 Tax=unclassified Bradyrhizobium TaxID=2631580 RepID=UPI001BAACE32|nr:MULTISPECIES: hypothetical protein [unclassified Bradyrhizobium]MBR1188817.1 hypothetical protein [Bradyrhizobium sp. AUGA SZCCT0160]MBR1198618.1 hypothetical protein [Bradyrhizobium sp. AUGA SZCCT0158]MBR1239577.1 hypothetical protein [Bradyrhizobium sp. AUGA SZCCT0274]MBR1255532.1 hypothetical protein [Bradyrhizobium sp. AUGA SZCCT0240]